MLRTGRSELSGLTGEEGEVRQAFVGIYWTLPVNWTGFRILPPVSSKRYPRAEPFGTSASA